MRTYDREVSAFERDGFVIARGVLTDADLRPVIDELSAFIDARARELHAAGAIADPAPHLDFGRRVVALYRQTHDVLQGMDIMELRGPAMFAFLHNENLLDLAEAFLGPELTCNPIQHVRAKIPFDADSQSGFMNVPWHQDVGVTHPDSEKSAILTFWMPLVDATLETGCMELMPDCVRLGALPHVTGKYGTEIDPQVLPDRVPVLGESGKGDVVVMSKYTPHRGTPNRSEIARWSIDLRYQVTGHHSGRLSHPDFPVRSRSNPRSVDWDHARWRDAWKKALAAPPSAPFHRVATRS